MDKNFRQLLFHFILMIWRRNIFAFVMYIFHWWIFDYMRGSLWVKIVIMKPIRLGDLRRWVIYWFLFFCWVIFFCRFGLWQRSLKIEPRFLSCLVVFNLFYHSNSVGCRLTSWQILELPSRTSRSYHTSTQQLLRAIWFFGIPWHSLWCRLDSLNKLRFSYGLYILWYYNLSWLMDFRRILF